jgi:hypothetical protein
MVSTSETAIFADKLCKLLALWMVLVLLADPHPRTLLELSVASSHALLDNMSIELHHPPSQRYELAYYAAYGALALIES